MKLKLLISIGCIIFLMACGKVNTNPKDFFPASVGQAKLEKVNFKDKEDWYEKSYESDNSGKEYKFLESTYLAGNYIFTYLASVHENGKLAQDEFAKMAVCKELYSGAKDWKESPIKDKSGKEIGNIKICRTEPDFEGKSAYFYALRKDNVVSVFKDSPSAEDANRIADFIKNLPLNTDLDLSFIDEIVAEAAKNKGVSKESLSNLAPPEQIAEKPYLKGKVYEISTEENKFIGDDLKAKNTSEIGSILKVSCGKGSLIGNYNADGQTVPAYTSNCKVTVIDYTIPAVIAKQFFANATIPNSMTFGTKDGKIESGKEVIAPIPFGDIKKWVDSLPKN
ncbi:MAG TPA: hypothetical protein PKY59_13950 [Pyrinomonadaceae bacterium]|nr:hypothetical protein [Pyrinomonadaceae bacterium]